MKLYLPCKTWCGCVTHAKFAWKGCSHSATALIARNVFVLILINRSDVVDNNCYCTLCVQEIFPFNHLDNDDDFYATVMEGVVECPYRLHESGNKVILTFDINDSFNTPFSSIDPDYHFYISVHFTVNMNCDYYFEDISCKTWIHWQ